MKLISEHGLYDDNFIAGKLIYKEYYVKVISDMKGGRRYIEIPDTIIIKDGDIITIEDMDETEAIIRITRKDYDGSKT